MHILGLLSRTGVVGLLLIVLYVLPLLFSLVVQFFYFLYGCTGGYIDTALVCPISPQLHGIGNMLIPLWLVFTSPVGIALLIVTVMRLVKLQKMYSSENQ